jgi:Ubiquitin carboxyl-terminal hydrolase, family 1
MRSRCDHLIHYEAITDYAIFLSTINQVVNNACATLAIVNALGNIPGLQVGDVLGNIFSFGVGMDAWVSDGT